MVPSARVVNHSGCSVTHGWSGAHCSARSRATSSPSARPRSRRRRSPRTCPVRVDGVVAAVGGADGPGRAGVVGPAVSVLLGPLRMWRRSGGSGAGRRRRSPSRRRPAAAGRRCGRCPERQEPVAGSRRRPPSGGRTRTRRRDRRARAPPARVRLRGGDQLAERQAATARRHRRPCPRRAARPRERRRRPAPAAARARAASLRRRGASAAGPLQQRAPSASISSMSTPGGDLDLGVVPPGGVRVPPAPPPGSVQRPGRRARSPSQRSVPGAPARIRRAGRRCRPGRSSTAWPRPVVPLAEDGGADLERLADTALAGQRPPSTTGGRRRPGSANARGHPVGLARATHRVCRTLGVSRIHPSRKDPARERSPAVSGAYLPIVTGAAALTRPREGDPSIHRPHRPPRAASPPLARPGPQPALVLAPADPRPLRR